MPKTEKLMLWVDLETTGSEDPHLDPILEVGMIVTRYHAPYDTVAAMSTVVVPEGDAWLDRLGDVVRQMHTDNGLLDDIAAAKTDRFTIGAYSPGAVAAATADQIVDRWVVSAVERLLGPDIPWRLELAGSGVAHFDRRWMAAQLPTLTARLPYGSHDIGAMRRLLRTFPEGKRLVRSVTDQLGTTDDKPHRAGADIRLHLDEARLYAEHLSHSLGHTLTGVTP